MHTMLPVPHQALSTRPNCAGLCSCEEAATWRLSTDLQLIKLKFNN